MTDFLSATHANGLLLSYRGQTISVRQALAAGLVKAYLDPGTDEILFVEIDPNRPVMEESGDVDRDT